MTAKSGRRPAGPTRGEARHEAREAALEMLYQWEIGGASVDEVVETYWLVTTHPPMADEAADFARRLAVGVVEHREQLDPLVAATSEHWRVERMGVIDRAIIRLAVYQFLHEKDTPPIVVIDEALELARTYSTDEAVKFINGVLDAVRKRLDEGA